MSTTSGGSTIGALIPSSTRTPASRSTAVASTGARSPTTSRSATPPPHPGYLNIGVLHTACEGAEGDHARYAPCSVDQLVAHGYDYWALGHVHARLVLHERPHVVYAGAIQGRSVREPASPEAPIETCERVHHPPSDASPLGDETDLVEPVTGPAPERLALYALADVGAALGEAPAEEETEDDAFDGDPPRGLAVRGSSDTEQQKRLRRILEAGDAARWRGLAAPAPSSLTALSDLGARAPHMASLTALVRRHVAAATTIGLPVALPPLLLIGEPGLGKTWFLSRMAAVLGIPFRRYAMTGQSLADGLYGSHPVWRSAGPGLVAKTLLSEPVANPLILVDEVDKATGHQREDPYRAFYDLLEPANARAFTDEYLQIPLDASRIVWLLAANDVAPLPAPVLDRLTVVAVASPDEATPRGGRSSPRWTRRSSSASSRSAPVVSASPSPTR